MENRLKERLTGAAILVALIVLLVPEMFHGQQNDAVNNAGSSGDGPPERSYTIDLSNSPARTAPLQSTPSAAALNPEPVPEPAAVHAPASSTAASASAPEPAVKAASVAVSAPAPAPPPSAVAAEHGGSSNLTVQLGMFAQRDNAERLMKAAQAKGFAVSVSNPDAKGLFRVRTNGAVDHAAALALQQRLRDQGFAAAIVTP
jgi:DedD protein